MRKPLIIIVAALTACMQMGCPPIHLDEQSYHIWNATAAPVIISPDGNTEPTMSDLACFQKPSSIVSIAANSERNIGGLETFCVSTPGSKANWYYVDGPRWNEIDGANIFYSSQESQNWISSYLYVLSADLKLYVVPNFDRDWILQGKPIDWKVLSKWQPDGFPLPGLGKAEAFDYYLKYCFEPYEARLNKP